MTSRVRSVSDCICISDCIWLFRTPIFHCSFTNCLPFCCKGGRNISPPFVGSLHLIVCGVRQPVSAFLGSFRTVCCLHRFCPLSSTVHPRSGISRKTHHFPYVPYICLHVPQLKPAFFVLPKSSIHSVPSCAVSGCHAIFPSSNQWFFLHGTKFTTPENSNMKRMYLWETEGGRQCLLFVHSLD